MRGCPAASAGTTWQKVRARHMSLCEQEPNMRSYAQCSSCGWLDNQPPVGLLVALLQTQQMCRRGTAWPLAPRAPEPIAAPTKIRLADIHSTQFLIPFQIFTCADEAQLGARLPRLRRPVQRAARHHVAQLRRRHLPTPITHCRHTDVVRIPVEAAHFVRVSQYSLAVHVL